MSGQTSQDMESLVVPSPLGAIRVVATKTGIVRLELGVEDSAAAAGVTGECSASELLCRARNQLDEYFDGARFVFDLPSDLSGLSPFVRTVLQELCVVPLGTTVSYGELAARVGRPQAARAVGRAMATNPLPLVIPCHRVVGKGGALTGYSGGAGISTKEWLLAHEAGVKNSCRGEKGA